jgi:chromate transporter
VLRRSLVRRGWISDADHRQLYALSRLTPGTNLLAYCTAVGWHTRGPRGAIVAWLAASVPCSLIALGVTVLYDRIAQSPTLALALLVATCIALVLLAASAWHLARPQLTWSAAPRSAVIILLTVGLVMLGSSPVTVLLAAAAVGALWPSPI